MSLVTELSSEIFDEGVASQKYKRLAAEARYQGHLSEAGLLEGIAQDEHRHSVLLRSIVDSLESSSDGIQLGGPMIEIPIEPKGRPFPETYGDWVNVGMDIKQADPSLSFMVNAALSDIEGGTEHADEQKRWLADKARELGVE